jgi:hypothetical protein
MMVGNEEEEEEGVLLLLLLVLLLVVVAVLVVDNIGVRGTQREGQARRSVEVALARSLLRSVFRCLLPLPQAPRTPLSRAPV